MDCKVTGDLNKHLAEQEAAERESDHRTSVHNDIAQEVTLKLNLAIDFKDWGHVYTICDEHGFDFTDWAMKKITEDDELRDAIFYREMIDATKYATLIVANLDLTQAVNDRIALEIDLLDDYEMEV